MTVADWEGEGNLMKARRRQEREAAAMVRDYGVNSCAVWLEIDGVRDGYDENGSPIPPADDDY